MAYLWRLAGRVVPMLYRFAYAVLSTFTSPLTELAERAEDWVGILAEPLHWLAGIVADIGGADVTLLEFMFVVGIPLVVAVALFKFFVNLT